MLSLPNDIFFDDITRQIQNGRSVRIKAKGNSMLPFIRNGKDEIVLAPLPHPPKKGMVALAVLADGRHIVHRIEKTENGNVTLRGDGNTTLREYCNTESIIAMVSVVIRNKKQIRHGSRRWNFYRFMWPANPFARRVLLAIIRRVNFLK